MNPARTSSLLSHLTLALAGIALSCAELDFLSEIPVILGIYLTLLVVSWQGGGRWTLSTWMANLLALVIAGVASGWIASHLGDSEANPWVRDVPIAVAVVPYLGPVVMALLLVRLFRPRSSSDFWTLQGLGLLQVALGCVITSGTLFGLLLLAYLILAICALTAQERFRQSSATSSHQDVAPSWPVSTWVGFGLRWTFAIAILALPLFLLTPRSEGPEWEPFSRFGVRHPNRSVARMGFSEEIDLTRTGVLQSDDSIAFTVTVTDHRGRGEAALPPDQRWRGIVLDRYEDGIWRGELNWPSGSPIARPSIQRLENTSDTVLLEYRVDGKAGGLFLADPIKLGPEMGVLPIRVISGGSSRRTTPLFFEAGGTIVPFSYLSRAEFHYIQGLSRSAPRDRYRAWRVRDNYLAKLLRVRPGQLDTWTHQLLMKLTESRQQEHRALREALVARSTTGDPLPPVHWETVAKLCNTYLADSQEFGYSLVLRREVNNIDPVMDFLLNVRQGTCERFASALALMVRSQGIPSRIIKGYRGADYSSDGVYQVRQRHAHAWVEVLVPSREEATLSFDWLQLDPTPSTESPLDTASRFSGWRLLQQGGQAIWNELIIGYNARQQADLWADLLSLEWWLAVAPWFGLVTVVLLATWLVRRQVLRLRRGLTQKGGPGLYPRLRDILETHLHLGSTPDETPREFAHRATAQLTEKIADPECARLLQRIVNLHYATRYGGHPPTESQVSELGEQLTSLEKTLKG